MERIAFSLLCLSGSFYFILSVATDAPALGSKNTPRLMREGTVSDEVEHQVKQNHTVLFYDEGSDEMYVGGTGFVLKLDMDKFTVKEKFSLKAAGLQQCQQAPCESVITVIEKLNDSLFVCGTTGQKAQCWKLFPSLNNLSDEAIKTYDGDGISPLLYTQRSMSMVADGDLYAAAPKDAAGRMAQFRRVAGKRTKMWMKEHWASEPMYIAAYLVKQMEDAENEKIYVFFREKNSDPSREADPWISKVARVCKEDTGGPKKFFQNTWTSFLKARLVCGFQKESVYFNRLQDIHVIPADDWHNTRVYALFTSSWNSTAVCVYTVGMIYDIFESSTFKGYHKDTPDPRPGSCIKDTSNLNVETISVLEEHSEMVDWVQSERSTAPFFVSSNNYTKITGDRVQAADQTMYNILLLATDSGKIHKVLETGSEPFIISETQLSSSSSIQAIQLDSKKKKLVVGLSEKISIVDLQRCQDYNSSCADCVLARDPYCAWTQFGCSPTVPGAIQDVLNGQITVCSSLAEEKKEEIRNKRDTLSQSRVNFVPLDISLYLSCPIHSYHAEYTWQHDNQSSPCLQMQFHCLHFIPVMTQDNYGTYKCVSMEKDYIKVMASYQLKEPVTKNINRRRYIDQCNDAVVPLPTWITLVLTAAVLDIFR